MGKKDIYNNIDFGDLSYLLDETATESLKAENLRSKDNEGAFPIETISLDLLVAFKNHPFQVNTDEGDFLQLVDSIKEQGLIYPILVRPVQENLSSPIQQYEIIAGHRRVAACREAGLTEVFAVIRPMDDFKATILMVHSNFHREKILISEKAKAYRMCMDAEKHQGKKGSDTAALIGKDQDSKRSVYRYIRLSYLSDMLLEMVDNKKLAVNTGVELSYLDEQSQDALSTFIQEYGIYPSAEQAAQLRVKYVEENTSLSFEQIVVCLTSDLKKKNKKNISFKQKDLQEYFDEDQDVEYMTNVILLLLSKYHNGDFDKLINKDDLGSSEVI